MESTVSDETSSLSDAFEKLSKFEKVNFDETVEVSCAWVLIQSKVHRALGEQLISRTVAVKK